MADPDRANPEQESDETDGDAEPDPADDRSEEIRDHADRAWFDV